MPNSSTSEGTPVTTPAATEIDIIAAASGPKRMRTDEGSVEERSISDLLLANKAGALAAVQDTVPWGIRIARGKPGGTVV